MKDSFAALILMAGEGRRLGSAIPKQFHPLGSRKIYQHTLQKFINFGIFQQIVLVCHPDWIETVRQEIPSHPSIKLVAGGLNRQASSLCGLKACKPSLRYVMIHDGVRPFVSQSILEKNKAGVIKHGAVDTCIPSSDTLVQYQGEFLTAIPPRYQFLRGQTPQTFEYQLILKAHLSTQQTEATDDCALVIEQGHPVAVVMGEEENMKITTEKDLLLAHSLLGQNC